MILFILVLVSILFLGDSFTSLFRCKLSCWERFGLAYGLGLAILTYGTFLFSLAGAPFNRWVLLFVFLVSLALIWYGKKKRRTGLGLKICWSRPTIPVVILGTAILLVSLSSLFESVFRPIYTWDALAIWGTKAKAIFFLGSVQAVKDFGAKPYYPLNIPIAMALFYHFGEPFVKSLFSLYFLALLAVFYGSLKRHGCGYVGSAGTLMLAATPFVFFHSTIAYANLPMALYYMASVIYLYQFFQDNNRAFLILSSVLVGIGCWTRPEGIMWSVPNLAVLTIYALRRKQWLDPILYVGPILAFFLPWSIFSRYIIETKSPYGSAVLGSIKQLFTLNVEPAHMWDVLRYFWQQVFVKENWLVVHRVLGWGYIWPLFFSLLILYSTRIRKHSYLLSIIGLDILVVLSTYYTLAALGRLHMILALGFNISFNRMTLYFFPLLLFQSVLLIAGDIRRCDSSADGRWSFQWLSPRP